MAEATEEQLKQLEIKDDDDDGNPNYKAPKEKKLTEIIEADQDDESLVKYKAALLGGVGKDSVILDPQNPLRVILKKMCILMEGRDEIVLDLTSTSDEEKTFVMKEGTTYQIQIFFQVQRDIVSGLKYVHKVTRKGVTVDKDSLMVGSYGPNEKMLDKTFPKEEAPKGLFYRGKYHIKSLFTDDDKTEYKSWSWNLDVRKDWSD